MLCPYCLTEVHFDDTLYSLGRVSSAEFNLPDLCDQQRGVHYFRGAYCPKCEGLIVAHKSFLPSGRRSEGTEYKIDDFDEVIFPRKAALRPVPLEVPQEYRQDFDEARLVQELSPKSSAALSRRLLQRVLHDTFHIHKPNLQQEIKEFLSIVAPPTHLAEQLDAIRVVGNFAAHPLKDTSTGQITDVEEGEAELLVQTLESLFDYSFVQPVKWTASKAALNTKLRAAGKPELP